MEYTINIKGRLMDLSTPQVMGILNVTPDSFYSGSREQTEMEIAQRANQIIEEGGSIIDVGAFSTRPGADEVSEEEEGRRLKFALDIVRREQPDAAVSVDTYRPTLARKCIEEWGADIINDVSEGGITGIANVPLEQRQEEYPEMFRVVGELKVPYILMSVQPTLETMMKGFAREVQQLRDLGAKDIILDPGFGFGKNLIQNYQIYNEMEKLNVMELPVLVGISRKSMIYKLLGGDATTSLNGTSVLDTIALMKESRSLNIFVGIMLFVLIWLFVSQVLEMRLLGSILDKLVSVGVIALIVIFQEDIRRFLYEIGSQKSMRRLVRFFHSSKESQKEANKETIMPIVLACMSMAKKYVGALIVIERGVPLKDIMDTGEEIDAKINQRLIENIFFKNSPLHDGAMVVSNKRIMAAGCILPVSHNLDIPKELGLRHRAALGISQSSDAIAVIVSEETGRISVAIKGEFKLRLSAEELESILTQEML